MLMLHCHQLNQKEKDNELSWTAQKKKLKINLKGSHINSIINNTKNNLTGQFEPMNSALPLLPNVQGVVDAAAMAAIARQHCRHSLPQELFCPEKI